MSAKSNTLVVISHPTLEKSKIHTAIISVAQDRGFDIHHIDQHCDPNGGFDVRSEQELLEKYDTIILQFPLYWYTVPAILKQYLDEVLTSDWAYDLRHALQGKTFAIVVTTAGGEVDYSHTGDVKFTLDELMAPLKATASFTRMTWGEPLYLYGVAEPTQETINSALTRVLARFE